MARLIGYMANRIDRMSVAFHQERDAITGTAGERRAWGIGFYQGDEVLHRKQPTADGEPVDWGKVTRDVSTDCAIAHVRHATVGAFSVDNTHPFRLRQWLFAHVGTLASFDTARENLLAELPDFLRRNIRGDSDSELYFHLLLAALHERGHLESPSPPHAEVVAAVSMTVKAIDAATGDTQSELNMLLTNGKELYALRRGGDFGYVEQSGLREPSDADGPPPPGSPLLRYVVLVGGDRDVPERYTRMEQGTVTVVDRDLGVHLNPLEH
jgi:predicted glutamine amidotransferase